MGYYMRFFTTDKNTSSIDDLNPLLQARHPSWRLKTLDGASNPSADIMFGEKLLGELEVNKPGDGLFEEEIDELLDFIDASNKGDREGVEELLQNATAAYVVRVLLRGRDRESTLETLDIFWEVLFQQHSGMLQADSEGYYDSSGMVLEVK